MSKVCTYVVLMVVGGGGGCEGADPLDPPYLPDLLTGLSNFVSHFVIQFEPQFCPFGKQNTNVIYVMFFRLALGQLSKIEGWSGDQLKAIIDRAKTVWAEAANEWDKDQVSELGKALSKCCDPKQRTNIVGLQ